MAKKMARGKIEKVMAESKGQWLSAEEIMYRANQTISPRASLMVGTVANHMRVMYGRGLVQIRNRQKISEYRFSEHILSE